MPYHDDLLQQAFDLIDKQPETQANLRRAVSAAYYSLFHLLINETVAHWDHPGSRGGLARMFEHSVMKRASDRTADGKIYPFVGADPIVVGQLRALANNFVELQEMRHLADYDPDTVWTRATTYNVVTLASQAFAAWQSIRSEKIAQDYLIRLLIKFRD